LTKVLSMMWWDTPSAKFFDAFQYIECALLMLT